jgi:hypothetical protein
MESVEVGITYCRSRSLRRGGQAWCKGGLRRCSGLSKCCTVVMSKRTCSKKPSDVVGRGRVFRLDCAIKVGRGGLIYVTAPIMEMTSFPRESGGGGALPLPAPFRTELG